MKHLGQNGFSQVALLLVVVVVVAVGFVGYEVHNHNLKTTTKSTAVIKTNDVPASINSSEDLNQAASALDNTNVDTSVDPNSLDNDINGIQ